VTTAPVVSFVIPVRDDAMRLRRCLQSVAGSRYPADRLEIIVADNGSTDGSDVVAREAGAVVLRLPGLRVSELRNRAVQAARGEILAFVDADHEIVPDWVPSAVEVLRDGSVGAVGASYHPPQDATWVQRLYDALRRHPAGRVDVEWLGSGNLAMRRAAFELVGGFDTALETCEDVDLGRRLRTRGLRLVNDERLRSEHHGDPATLRAVFMGELWRGRDNLRVSLRRPLSWRSLVSMAMPLAMLSALASVAVGVSVTLAAGSPVGLRMLGVGMCGAVLVVASRTGRMLLNQPSRSGADMFRAAVVAFVYELGRALAPVLRTTHRRRQAAASRRWACECRSGERGRLWRRSGEGRSDTTAL
jgi:Glycosyl transferase family 2